MDISASEWSSGCESGWTGYLDESYMYPTNNNNNVGYHNHQSYRLDSMRRTEGFEREEEDLSMVSDASSGPPQYPEYEEQCIFRTVKKKATTEKKSKKASKLEHKKLGKYVNNSNNINNNLDDTASSPAISYSKMYGNPSSNQASAEHFMSYSKNLSASHHFQGNSAFSNHYSFWHSSHPDNADSAEPSHMRRWE